MCNLDATERYTGLTHNPSLHRDVSEMIGLYTGCRFNLDHLPAVLGVISHYVSADQDAVSRISGLEQDDHTYRLQLCSVAQSLRHVLRLDHYPTRFKRAGNLTDLMPGGKPG